jgi:hypothetical protein
MFKVLRMQSSLVYKESGKIEQSSKEKVINRYQPSIQMLEL